MALFKSVFSTSGASSRKQSSGLDFVDKDRSSSSSGLVRMDLDKPTLTSNRLDLDKDSMDDDSDFYKKDKEMWPSSAPSANDKSLSAWSPGATGGIDASSLSFSPLPSLPHNDSMALRARLSELGGSLPKLAGKKKRKTLLLPQRPQDEGKITVVLDMDETLIHSEFMGDRDYRQAEFREKATRPPDFHIVLYEDDPFTPNELVHVYKRPGVDRFLERLSEICEPVIFTASLPLYARPILQHIDPKRLCKSRLYRNATIKYRGYPHVKCLKNLGRDAKRTVLVDNSPYAMCADPYNGIPIKSWYDDTSDRELDSLLEFIEELVKYPDVRPILHKKYNFVKVLDEVMGDN